MDSLDCDNDIYNVQPVRAIQRAKTKQQSNTVNPSIEGEKMGVHNTEPDKYSMGLIFAKKCDKIKRAKASKKNALFWKQNPQMFGYIPINGLPEPVTRSSNYPAMEPLEAHELLKNETQPNYLGLRIPVASGLNVKLWGDLLEGYWDTQLDKINHKSAQEFPDDIKAYLEEEISHKAILGSFKDPPEGIHTSPFMTREKPGSQHRRVIIDLSWPAGSSVNAGVDADMYAGAKYILTFPSIDH